MPGHRGNQTSPTYPTILGMPPWLAQLFTGYQNVDRFRRGLAAGIDPWARTQAARGLNRGSALLGALSQRVTANQSLAAAAASRFGVGAANTGFRALEASRSLLGPQPSTQNLPLVQGVSQAMKVIPQQLQATYGARGEPILPRQPSPVPSRRPLPMPVPRQGPRPRRR